MCLISENEITLVNLYYIDALSCGYTKVTSGREACVVLHLLHYNILQSFIAQLKFIMYKIGDAT